MYRPVGRGFCAVLVWKRVYTLPILVGIGYGFRGNYGSVWTYLSFQFQMSKKGGGGGGEEKEKLMRIRRRFFVCALILKQW